MRKLVDTFPKSYIERVFVVRTAIDMNVQRAAEEAVENQLRQFGRDYHATQAATVVADLDGGVRAMVGGRDYGASQFNRATDAYRQPGSSFKPYVYTTALLNGFTPNSIVVDGPVCIGNWCPQNYGHSYSGSVTLTQAITRSINVVPVKLSIALGGKSPNPAKAGRVKIVEVARQLRPQGAAARYAVDADRLRRSHRARTRGRLCDLPEQGQVGHAALRCWKSAPAPATWSGASTATARSRCRRFRLRSPPTWRA